MCKLGTGNVSFEIQALFTDLTFSLQFLTINSNRFPTRLTKEIRHNMNPRAVLRTTAVDPSLHTSTDRRQEVLDLLCKGLTNAEIGQLLGIGSRTVKWYVSQLLMKYEATNRTELVGIVLSRDRAS